MLDRWFKKSPEKQAAKGLYGGIVEAARAPALYGDAAAPDTVEGRLELIMLHTALVMDVLRSDDTDQTAVEVAQALFDVMFDDFDAAMREMGVGDSGVGKKIRFMAEGFYGRSQSYLSALASQDPSVLADVLARNIYADEGRAEDAHSLADYVSASHLALVAQGRRALSRGDCPRFVAP
jgi:cytochrome b pre-mRNA-processing protein 3